MDDAHIGSLLVKAVNKNWDRKSAINYMLDKHTWDGRAQVYHSIINKSDHFV